MKMKVKGKFIYEVKVHKEKHQELYYNAKFKNSFIRMAKKLQYLAF